MRFGKHDHAAASTAGTTWSELPPGEVAMTVRQMVGRVDKGDRERSQS